MKRGTRFLLQPPLEEGRDRDVRCERFFCGLQGAGGGGGERHDGVDGGLKGNERRMMQAWVRIAAKAGDSLCRRAREKKERRDVRVGE